MASRILVEIEFPVTAAQVAEIYNEIRKGVDSHLPPEIEIVAKIAPDGKRK